MKTNSFKFGPAKGDELKLWMAAKRYTPERLANGGASGQVPFTLLFVHGLGLHKEIWEPIISNLFESPKTRFLLREAWAFDWQTHGESAVLNEEKLKNYPKPVGGDYWARALAEFVRSEHVNGHRLILIGHSAGTTAAMYSTKFFMQDQTFPFSGIVLVEPPLIDKETFNAHLPEGNKRIKAVSQVLAMGRTTWKSFDHAYGWMSKIPPWKKWDRRALRLYVDHGLLAAKDAEGSDCVRVKCSKQREIEGFRDFENTFEATEYIAPTCKLTSLHVILGGDEDLLPQYGYECVMDASKGRKFSSVVTMPNVGHMIVQEKPHELAETLGSIIGAINRHCTGLSKL
ncbi:alpha/beta-hydrolase [Marasmius fiardii PR-910]|nr:alpha/beta-hydrolase [Marasmius fiardii PR-910]